MAAPSKFAHVVYQTHRFEEMVDWYKQVFEATVRHKDDKLAFLSYDDEHHRMAFLNLGPSRTEPRRRRRRASASTTSLTPGRTWASSSTPTSG